MRIIHELRTQRKWKCERNWCFVLMRSDFLSFSPSPFLNFAHRFNRFEYVFASSYCFGIAEYIWNTLIACALSPEVDWEVGASIRYLCVVSYSIVFSTKIKFRIEFMHEIRNQLLCTARKLVALHIIARLDEISIDDTHWIQFMHLYISVSEICLSHFELMLEKLSQHTQATSIFSYVSSLRFFSCECEFYMFFIHFIAVYQRPSKRSSRGNVYPKRIYGNGVNRSKDPRTYI